MKVFFLIVLSMLMLGCEIRINAKRAKVGECLLFNSPGTDNRLWKILREGNHSFELLGLDGFTYTTQNKEFYQDAVVDCFNRFDNLEKKFTIEKAV